MLSFLFYDPDGVHQSSQFDLHIYYIRDPLDLAHFLEGDNRPLQVLCVCCQNKSTIAEQVKDKDNILAIYLCKDHNGPPENPLYDRKVHDDVIFSSRTGWEFQGRLELALECSKQQRDQQLLYEKKRIGDIQTKVLRNDQMI